MFQISMEKSRCGNRNLINLCVGARQFTDFLFGSASDNRQDRFQARIGPGQATSSKRVSMRSEAEVGAPDRSFETSPLRKAAARGIPFYCLPILALSPSVVWRFPRKTRRRGRACRAELLARRHISPRFRGWEWYGRFRRGSCSSATDLCAFQYRLG